MHGVSEAYQAQVATGEITADAGQAGVVAALDTLAATLSRPARRGFFAKPEAAAGLYIWGDVGRGKSMLMDMFVDAVAVLCRRVHFHAFMQEVHDALHQARQEATEDALKPFLDRVGGAIRLLAFDEMQISDIADAMIVGRLFEGLSDRGVAIVTTSNRPPDDLYLNGLNRSLFLPFIAMLKERFAVVELTGPTDYRRNRLSGERLYFTPANAAARAAIDGLWHDLSGGRSEILALRIKGRDVVIPAFHNGVARATFFDLCGRHLGPGDYLALAGHVRALILEDIPVLSRRNFNEARRFVTLIDALYEARARLICSAAAGPDMLYVEGEGTFEFRRTASRLQEMTSAGWGG